MCLTVSPSDAFRSGVQGSWESSGYAGVDWWCLGITLYEMLTGTHPFWNANRDQMYMSIVTDDVRAGEREGGG